MSCQKKRPVVGDQFIDIQKGKPVAPPQKAKSNRPIQKIGDQKRVKGK